MAVQIFNDMPDVAVHCGATRSTLIADPDPAPLSPPVVESVEYLRAPAPVYPADSRRRRERGTVLLRVLVDEVGRPAQIQLERSSGYP